MPGADTPWQLEQGDVLTPETPVTLVWDNGSGLIFRREISVDDQYMFAVSQSVENTTDAAMRLAPYGIVARHGEPDTTKFFVLHEGVVRMTDGELQEVDYNDMPDLDFVDREQAPADVVVGQESGWVGFTDQVLDDHPDPDGGNAIYLGGKIRARRPISIRPSRASPR